MTRKLLLWLSCWCALLPALHAQTPDAPRAGGRLTGTVLDSATRQPVSFATVALVDAATRKPADGAICDEQGRFTLGRVPAGTWLVSVSFIGYRTLSMPLPETAGRGADLSLGAVLLPPEVQKLKEVTVVGQANVFEEKVDRTVYNAELDQTAKGGDATDVLRRVPLLTVDLNGNVSLRGNQNLTVLINGKPSTLTAGGIADALKQIPSDMIKTVEVITSPSAKYDAEGSGGIINIITKKNTLQGLSLNIDANAGLRGSNLGLNGGYRKGKMGFSLGGFGRANYNVTGNFENDQTSLRDGAARSRSLQQAATRNSGAFGRYTLGWDYELNKYNSLNASVQFGLRNNKTYQDGLSTLTFLGDRLAGDTRQDVRSTDLSNNVDLNLNYTRTFDKPQREFSIVTQYSRNNRTNDFLRTALTPGLPSIKNLNDSYNQEMTVQADYQTPFTENQLFEVGGKNISRRVSSDFQYLSATGGGPFVQSINGALSNALQYDQNVTAGYFSYTLSTARKYSLKVGSRYEYTTIRARFQDNEAVSIPSYGVLVPSLNLSRRLAKGNMVKFAYNRRIQRPSLRFLNPNIQAANPLDITVGNPVLEPEFTNNFEVSYNTTVKNNNLSFSTFARNTNNAIQGVRQPIGRGDTVQTSFQNIGRENAYGGSVFLNLNLSNKFSLNGGTDFFYAVLNNNVPDPLYRASNQGWVASYRLFGSYNFSKGWGLQLFSFYRGRQVQLQGVQGGFGIYSLSVRKEFKNKKGSIGLGAENFFTPRFRIRNEIVSPLIVQRSVNELHNMNLKLTFNYRIGKIGFENTPRRKRSVNNDDLKDGDGGGNDGGGGPGGGGGGPQRGGNAPQRPATGQPAPQRPAGPPRPDSTQARPDTLPAPAKTDTLSIPAPPRSDGPPVPAGSAPAAPKGATPPAALPPAKRDNG